MRRCLLVAFLLFGSVLCLRAQSFDASQWNQGVTTITAPWRFHPGDDPAWASPSFDDSKWSLLATDRLWGKQGYPKLKGYGWYRLRLKLPATTQPLGIDIGQVSSSAELYLDGKLLGTYGIMRPKPDWTVPMQANAFPLPLSCNGQWVEIAVRVWKSPVSSSFNTGGFRRHPIVGSLPLLQAARRVAFDNEAASLLVPGIVYLVVLVLGCFGLGLFLLDRRSTEYAWFALSFIGTAVVFLISTAATLSQHSQTFAMGDRALLMLPCDVAAVLFIWGFLRARRGWLFVAAVILAVVGRCVYDLAFHGFLPLPAGEAIVTVALTLAHVLVAVQIVLSLRAGSRDARLLLVPVVLLALGICIDGVRQAIFFAGLSENLGPVILWSNGVISVAWMDIIDVLYAAAVAAALILRFTRSAREEKRLSTELESARAVQEHLVPAQLPTLPGLQLGAVYLPAAEVGGDFYQVFQQRDDSALVVVGDVSGKGLRAAMTGTLVLGGLRALVQENLSPSQILSRLNNQLAGSTEGGFVTCLCARISPDGLITLANAGHLAPYRNGEECEVDSGLPLGVVAGAEYTETTVQFEAGDTLTFLSDGVVEAQTASGELFGFERTRAISHQSAEEIAAAAQQFGQQDDISVLTISFAPAAVLQV